MIEQHSYSGDYTNSYKFNGKELDEETGFYYYGARYYNPKFSIWLSVDPLAEKFPNASPYNYCLGNPINLVDPDGRAPMDHYRLNTDGTLIMIKKTSHSRDKIFSSDYKQALIVPKSFISSKTNDLRNGTTTTIFELESSYSKSSDVVFNFFARNSFSEFSMQQYKDGDKIRTFISTGNTPENGGYGGYYSSELVMDANKNATMLKDVHSHTDFPVTSSGGLPVGSKPSGFLDSGEIDTTANGDRAYRSHFEKKYGESRLPSSFEIRLYPVRFSQFAKKFNVEKNCPNYGKSIFYTDEKYWPNYNK